MPSPNFHRAPRPDPASDPRRGHADAREVGRRTGVQLPSRGEVPFDADGRENADAFFDAARSPLDDDGAPSPERAHGGRRCEEERARERARREEERAARRRALEEEGRRNLGRRPELLREEEEEYEDEEGAGRGRGRARATPQPAGWTNRLLHQAMGVPTEDSPAHTALSRVSTAAPSTARGSRHSLDTIATEPRHGLRAQRQGDGAPREGSARSEEEEEEEAEASPPPAAADASEGEEGEGGGPIDPPEEMSQAGYGEKTRGVDPEERDHYIEPEDKEEMEQEDANKLDEHVAAKPSAGEEKPRDDDIASRESARSATSGGDDVSAKPSGKSAASAKSGATDPLEDSLEAVVQNPKYAKYSQDFDDDFANVFDNDDNEGEGAMQLATQPEEQLDDFHVDFGNDGGFDDGGDLRDDEDEMHRQASQKSRGSRASDESGPRKSNESEMSASLKSHAGSRKSHKSRSDKSHTGNLKSDRSHRSTGQPPTPEDEDEEEEAPSRKNKSDKVQFARKPAPTEEEADATPPSVLRKKSRKKKPTTAHRVNWSTPNGRSLGIPLANRDYEAHPVSEYKEDLPDDDDDDDDDDERGQGGALRRSRRAKFKPLQFWKNEKLIYEAQNEEGLLGKACCCLLVYDLRDKQTYLLDDTSIR